MRNANGKQQKTKPSRRDEKSQSQLESGYALTDESLTSAPPAHTSLRRPRSFPLLPTALPIHPFPFSPSIYPYLYPYPLQIPISLLSSAHPFRHTIVTRIGRNQNLASLPNAIHPSPIPPIYPHRAGSRHTHPLCIQPYIPSHTRLVHSTRRTIDRRKTGSMMRRGTVWVSRA